MCITFYCKGESVSITNSAKSTYVRLALIQTASPFPHEAKDQAQSAKGPGRSSVLPATPCDIHVVSLGALLGIFINSTFPVLPTSRSQSHHSLLLEVIMRGPVSHIPREPCLKSGASTGEEDIVYLASQVHFLTPPAGSVPPVDWHPWTASMRHLCQTGLSQQEDPTGDQRVGRESSQGLHPPSSLAAQPQDGNQ